MQKLTRAVAFLLLSLPCTLVGQQYFDYQTYTGPSNSLYSNSEQKPGGSVVQFQFCTFDVQDSIVITYDGVEYPFFIGGLGLDFGDSAYGYSEFNIYGGTVDTVALNNVAVPAYFKLDVDAKYPCGRAVINLFIEGEDCVFSYRLRGNPRNGTVYEFSAAVLKTGEWPNTYEDKIRCSNTGYYPIFDVKDCRKVIYNYIDASGLEEPRIVQPTCENSSDGSIVFKNPAVKSLLNLKPGTYEVILDSAFCTEARIFTLQPKNICNLYIPNAVSDEQPFKVFTKDGVILNFNIKIYDRWGGMIINRNTNSEEFSLSLNQRFPGVFIYQIVFENGSSVSGDVTLIK